MGTIRKFAYAGAILLALAPQGCQKNVETYRSREKEIRRFSSYLDSTLEKQKSILNQLKTASPATSSKR